MNFDEILDHIGEIGFYQVWLFLLLGCMEYITADAIAMNFIGGNQDHWFVIYHLKVSSFVQNILFVSKYDRTIRQSNWLGTIY